MKSGNVYMISLLRSNVSSGLKTRDVYIISLLLSDMSSGVERLGLCPSMYLAMILWLQSEGRKFSTCSLQISDQDTREYFVAHGIATSSLSNKWLTHPW